MSDYLRLGHATETTAVISYRSESNGVLTVDVNGSTFTGDTLDTSVDYGLGVVTATGLSPDTSYPFTLKVGGVTVRTGTLMTMPPEDSIFTVGVGSCIHPKREYTSPKEIQRVFSNLKGYIFLGDTPYQDDAGTITRGDITINDVSLNLLADPADELTLKDDIYKQNHFLFNRTAVRSVVENYPTYAVMDDHERPGDNWDWSIAKANDTRAWATTLTEVRNVGIWCRDAWHKVWKGTPLNSSALNDSARPDSEQVYYDYVIGDAHFIMTDGLEYSDITAGNDLGATQLAWLKDVLLNSASTWKVCMAGKTPYGLTNQNWAADLQAFIVTNNIYGVVWFGGDVHYPQVIYQEGLLMLTIAPTSQTFASVGAGYPNGIIYRVTGNDFSSPSEKKIFFPSGFVTIEGKNRLVAGMIDQYGNKKVQFAIKPDSFGYEQVNARDISL